MDEETRDYLRRREQREQAAAKNSQSEEARRVHQQLAQRYAELLAQEMKISLLS